MKTRYWIIPLLCLSIGLAACHDDRAYYPMVALKSIHLEHMDNAGKMPVTTTKPYEVKKEAYILRIQLLCGFPAGNLYGDARSFQLEYGIRILQITTINDLNDDYPAGSDVTECFQEYPLPLPDNIRQGWSGDEIKYIYHRKPCFYKALMETPKAGEHQFLVKLTLANDEVMEETTPIINLY